jgi:hypothetical protein
MARNSRKYKEPNEWMDTKLFFYIFTIGSIALIGFMIWFFGVDFGVFQVGGVGTMAVGFWIFVALLVMEYIVDVRYALSLCKRFKIPSAPAFIPLLNCFVLWGKVMKIAAIACLAVIILAVVVIATPVIMYIAPAYFMESVNIAIAAIIAAAVGLMIIRGVQEAKLKIDLINKYKKLVGLGAAPAMGIFKSLLYFLPIVRVVLLLEDLTFINNVFHVMEKNKRVERGEL